MNALRVMHASIRAKFWSRLFSFALYVAGYILLGVVDWRLPLGIYFIISAWNIRRGMGDN